MTLRHDDGNWILPGVEGEKVVNDVGVGGRWERESSVQLSSCLALAVRIQSLRNSPLVLSPAPLLLFGIPWLLYFEPLFLPVLPVVPANLEIKRPAGNHGYHLSVVNSLLPLLPDVRVSKMGNLGDLSPQGSVAVSHKISTSI